MSSEFVVEARGLGKCYRIYEYPQDRLKEGALSVAARTIPGLRNYFAEQAKRCGKDFWALENATFSIRRGETIGIIGRNGSGKSTLLQILCGILAPTSGVVSTRGRIAALLELGAGFNPEFTGRENVFLNAQILGLSRQQVIERFDSIVAFAEIERFIDQPVKSYSSGMFLRLAFAVIVHVDADILVIDEALAVGDAYFTQKCMRFLHEFMSHGTVLFVSHDIGSVKALAERSIWLEGGRVKMMGATREIADRYLEALYAEHQSIDGAIETSDPCQGFTETPPVHQHDFPCNAPETPPEVEVVEVVEVVVDFRLDRLAEAGLANRLKVVRFDPNAHGFGDGKAQIREVRLLDRTGQSKFGIQGGERVTLEITVDVRSPLEGPIIGFFLRNRLGQNVFGDNSFFTTSDAPLSCPAGGQLVGRFEFIMPFLPRGDYAFSVAIASGSNLEHVQHQWLHDALMIESISLNVHADVMGVPMAGISLDFLAPSEKVS